MFSHPLLVETERSEEVHDDDQATFSLPALETERVRRGQFSREGVALEQKIEI
jgi:hypothetical protein